MKSQLLDDKTPIDYVNHLEGEEGPFCRVGYSEVGRIEIYAEPGEPGAIENVPWIKVFTVEGEISLRAPARYFEIKYKTGASGEREGTPHAQTI